MGTLEHLRREETDARSRRRRPRGIDGKLAGLFFVLILISCIISLPALRSSRTDAEGKKQETDEAEPPTLRYRGSTLPVLENVPVNEYAKEAFSTDESGYLRYPDAPLGIDVSSHQGEIDWAQVSAAGIDFVMLRAGRRGYTEGGLFPDDMFRRNIDGALAAGLEVGVYFFSQAITVEEAGEEADYVLELIGDYDISYPVAFDWEFISEDQARTDGLGAEEMTQCAAAFCDAIAEAGYAPVIYFNVSQGYLSYQLDQLTDYSFWLAEYHDSPGFYYHFDLWQYTHQGSVPGISGAVDMDLDLRAAERNMPEQR